MLLRRFRIISRLVMAAACLLPCRLAYSQAVLSATEQAARVEALVPRMPGAAVQPGPYSFFQRDYRIQWLSASGKEHNDLAEGIGEQGRARWAAEQGWTKVLGSQRRGINQGVDAVYWDSRRGLLLAVESKGGTSRIGSGYKSRQNTNMYSVRAAEMMLENTKTNNAEKVAAARILVAAHEGRLETLVVKTPHKDGFPGKPRMVGEPDQQVVAFESRKIERQLLRTHPELKLVFFEARRSHAEHVNKYIRSNYGIRQASAGFGLVSSALLAWDAYEQSSMAWESWRSADLRRTALPYWQTASAVGRWSQSGTLMLGSAAELGLLTNARLYTVGRVAGKWFLPVAALAEGLSASVTYYEYSSGRISRRDLYRRSVGPAVFAIFTTGGAIIGGVMGAPAGGIGAGPGAVAGAGLGAMVAIPFQMAADQTVGWYYRKFDEKQQQAVDRALERHYGLSE